ncbi:ribosomal protein L15 [Candidozyma pseudohaemuli]|uniref:Ribosomal protein L15 n=1 Tax=Candidozyma pseudohaemuli TaxID=418784 RepID=A0A2P7YPS6_9ASCO|nr:ribosomal protein L15 [[Candida] pseudohaemulonii]PSK37967.1 ribosomal protein L15 [[Candida] pseudohaemulonii]
MGFFSAAKTAFAPVGLLLNQQRGIAKLGFLAPFEGATKSIKRVGRGQASGLGKTSGRGQKGQKARGKVPRWFEGGQTPYFKRFPIIGFKRPHKRVYNDLNLEKVQHFWEKGRIPLREGDVLDYKVMRECGLVTGTVKDGVKLLGNGKETYNVPLNIEATRASTGAINAVERTGHSYTSVYRTKLGLQAFLNPDRFLLRKGYVPLQARPMHKRDIAYYLSEERRGYLLKDRLIFLDQVEAVQSKMANKTKRIQRKTELERQLDSASSKAHNDFAQSRVVDLASL